MHLSTVARRCVTCRVSDEPPNRRNVDLSCSRQGRFLQHCLVLSLRALVGETMEMSSCRVFVCDLFFWRAHSFTPLHKDTRYMFFCSKVFCFGEFGSGSLNSCVGKCTQVFALQFTRKSVCPMMLRFTDSQRKLRHRLLCCRVFFFFFSCTSPSSWRAARTRESNVLFTDTIKHVPFRLGTCELYTLSFVHLASAQMSQSKLCLGSFALCFCGEQLMLHMGMRQRELVLGIV